MTRSEQFDLLSPAIWLTTLLMGLHIAVGHRDRIPPKPPGNAIVLKNDRGVVCARLQATGKGGVLVLCNGTGAPIITLAPAEGGGTVLVADDAGMGKAVVKAGRRTGYFSVKSHP